MAEDIIRKLPFSAIAEQSLLGSILIDPESINQVADSISADDFYLEEHKQIYLAMHSLYLTNNQIDVVTLIDELVKKGVYSKSGGEDYIKVIAQTVPNALMSHGVPWCIPRRRQGDLPLRPRAWHQ